MAQENLSGKIAVITGGGRGIGYAVAQRLLEEGAKVAFCALRQNSVDAALASLSEFGDVVGVVADVSNLNDVRHFFDVVRDRFGGADILVNNVGIRTYQAVADLNPADWDRMLAVNLTGAFYCSHEILPMLKQRGGGDVINVSSLSSTSPFAGGAGYNASKAGLNGLSEATMLDHRYDGVRVTSVMPGSTRTDFNADLSASSTRDQDEWKVAPEDIAEVVATLLKMPRRTTISRVDVKPSRPPRKTS
jgi:3-oxoacyl-[acyl-carrier protein] reductase